MRDAWARRTNMASDSTEIWGQNERARLVVGSWGFLVSGLGVLFYSMVVANAESAALAKQGYQFSDWCKGTRRLVQLKTGLRVASLCPRKRKCLGLGACFLCFFFWGGGIF